MRYYEPETGRYLTRDPIGYLGGANVYVCVFNNPVNHIDPLGLAEPATLTSALVFAGAAPTAPVVAGVAVVVSVPACAYAAVELYEAWKQSRSDREPWSQELRYHSMQNLMGYILIRLMHLNILETNK